MIGERRPASRTLLTLTHLSPTALAMDLSDWEVADDGLRLTV
jgi:hypothetical protein